MDCPNQGPFCEPVHKDNVDEANKCKSVNTKKECISLMKQYPCIWNPYNNLPNSNFIDIETMRYVQIPKYDRSDQLEKVHESFETKPDLYRLDDCGIVYALNHRDNSILQELS